MKILFIGMGWFESQKGGLNRYLFDMVSILKNSISNYSVVYCSDKSYNSNHYNFKCKNLFYKIFKSRQIIKQAIKNMQPDVINIHFALYALSSMNLLKKYKIVMNFQGPWAKEGLAENKTIQGIILSYIKKQIELYVYKRCDSFIVLSNEFKNILINEYGIESNKIYIVPPTLNAKLFKNNSSKQYLREKYNIPNNKTILFTARRLVKRTGVNLLIDAVLKLNNKEIILLIAGKGHLEKTLKEKASINNNIIFLGFVSDEELVDYYALSDITIMPTVSLEGFGLTTIESLASGTPVIATPSSANKEVISKFDKNLLTDKISSNSLAKKLNYYINNKEKLPSKDICQKHIEEHYSGAIFVKNIFKVFEGK